MAPTATWTAPRDWTAGETLSAANFDTYLSSNLLWLKTPPTETDTFTGADITTTSTSFVVATGLSIALTTTGGRVLLGFSGVVSNSNANQAVNVSFYYDATLQGNATYGYTQYVSVTGGQRGGATMTMITPALSAGAHTFEVHWKVSANTGTMYADCHFYAREV